VMFFLIPAASAASWKTYAAPSAREPTVRLHCFGQKVAH
jgi:hypothetical protein